MRTTPKPTIVAAALATAFAFAAPAQAALDDYEECASTTDYSLRLDDGRAVFDHRTGHDVELGPGRLLVDGREVALSAADRERIARYHAAVMAIVPEVKDIAIEAVGIAFTAIEQVARSFASGTDLEATVERLADKQTAAIARIGDSFEREAFNEAAFEKLVEHTVEEIVPEVAALAAGAAVRAALAGEAMSGQLEQRVAELEKTIEREVEQRAAGLERRAENLCRSLRELDAIESQMTVQIDGKPFDLIRVDD